MKLQPIFNIMCTVLLFTGFSPDAAEPKQGTWKLIQVRGMLTEPNWFNNHCELITFYGNLADYFINGEHKFSGDVDSLILKYYKLCTLSVAGDTLRLTRAQEQEDVPFSWEWVRYSDSLLNIDGTWRWIETIGGIAGTTRTRSDYFRILKASGSNIVNTVNDSIVFSGNRDSLFSTSRTPYNWIIVADTLIAFQKPQCCDIPYIYKWIRWVSGQTGVRVSNRFTAVSENEKQMYFDIRGRKIAQRNRSSSSILLLYNKNSMKSIVNLQTDRSSVLRR